MLTYVRVIVELIKFKNTFFSFNVFEFEKQGFGLFCPITSKML